MSVNTYLTGKPCKRGHLSLRSVIDRGCVECKRVRGMEDYRANTEKHRVRKAVAYAANPEKWHARTRAWCQANRKRASNFSRNWQKRNEQRDRARKAAYRRAHPEIAKASARLWQQANAARCVVNVQRRDARKKNAPGRGVTADQWQQVLDDSLGLCAYCSERGPLTMDHIEPLLHGGAHDIDNIATVCKSCNCRKRARPLLLWLAIRGTF